MNTRFKFALIRHLNSDRHQGFALPMAMMVGMVMLVVGITMVIRAQGDQSKAVAQTSKTIANAAAEAGLTRIQNFLVQNPALAQYSMEEWKTAMVAYQGNANTTDATLTGMVGLLKQQSCSYSGQSDATIKQTLVPTMATFVASSGNSATGVENSLPNPDSSNSTFAPSFQLKGYVYSNKKAQAVLVGKAGQQSKATLAVTIPVDNNKLDASTQAFPGLWVREYLRAGQNDNNPGTLNAHVLYDCGINAGTFTTTAQTNGSASGYTYYVSSGTANGGTAIRVALPTGNPAPEKSLLPMPNPPTSAPSGVTPVSLGSITSSLTLPRTTSNASPNNVNDTTSSSNYSSTTDTYYYTVSSISGNGVNLQFTPGKKVVVFLTGNISIGGTSQITHRCTGTSGCDATDVQILGSTSNTKGSFITKGTSAVCSLFFWAPTYTVEMSGGGNAGACASDTNPATTNPPSQPANQNGIYWVRAWIGGGQGAHQALNQSGSSWTQIKSVASLPAVQLGVPTEWAMKADDYTLTLNQTTPSTNTADAKSPTGSCTVPNLVGMTLTDADSTANITQAILSAGLGGGGGTMNNTYPNDTTQTTVTTVSAQDPAAGPYGSDCSQKMMTYTYKIPTGLIPTTLIDAATNNGTADALINGVTVNGTQCFTVGTKTIQSGGTGSPKVKSISFTPVGGSTVTWTTIPANAYVTCGIAINYTYR